MDKQKIASSYRTGTTSELDEVLKGEAFTLSLPEHVHASDADTMLRAARPRFGPNGIWTINAEKVKSIDFDARDRLVAAFIAFREKGGAYVLVCCDSRSPLVTTAFIAQVRTAGGLELHCAETVADLRKLGAEIRAQREQQLRKNV